MTAQCLTLSSHNKTLAILLRSAFRSHQIGGENPGQFDLPPTSPLAALILSTAASSVSSGHTLSVRGRQLVATATSIAVKDLGLGLTLTGQDLSLTRDG